MVFQVVSEAIENTDVNIGLDNNGQLQVAVLPKDQEKVNCGGYKTRGVRLAIAYNWKSK